MYKSIDSIRQEFLNFFQKKQHQVISSSSLVPENDRTLLFTNSGMNQFKNIFLGLEELPASKRIVTVQRCMRAGGKHNDLNNVGYTDRHLTFFEMLGNFSFGDYFKTDAIQFAWELLTDSNWFNLSKDKIWVTTHVCDDESYNIWLKYIGIPRDRIIKIGNKKNDFNDSDNFWKMGNFGPCGPCSEIFYDQGYGVQQDILTRNVLDNSDRYIEIWNLVFMQFDRQIDGRLIPLPMLSVDTGMGLERITSVLQGVHSSYLIDIFKKLIIAITQVMKLKVPITNRSLYVIADHIRACAFLIRDGIIPSNEGRGYVLRRIIRRAIRHGKKLGVNSIFLCKLVVPLITKMQYISHILQDHKDLIENILFNEEELFKDTLNRGLELLEKELMQLSAGEMLHGDVVYRLYTTYGFPIELTKDICHERNIGIDVLKFDQFMLQAKKNSKKSNQFHVISDNTLPFDMISKFVGYQFLRYQSRIIALFQNNVLINIINSDIESIVVLDITPFYGESGGQIGDSGYLKTVSGIFKVINTKKYKQTILHIGIIQSGSISIGEQVFSKVDQVKRQQISLNHSATHLLHMALLKILGLHITQRGSLVNDKYLRFDFSHYKSMTESQISIVENLINNQIWKNMSIQSNIMSIQSARAIGAIMLDQKQYNQKVRVLRIGDFSSELCVGTHAKYTGEIGFFIIIKECGIGSGIRRIEAATKDEALSIVQNKKILIENVVQIMHSDEETVLNKLYKFKSRFNKLEKELKNFENKQEIQKSLFFVKDVHHIKGIPILIKQLKYIKSYLLIKIVNNFKNYLKSGIIIVVNIKKNNSVHMIISVIKKDLIDFNHINALDIVDYIIHNFGGKGGGKPDFAHIGISNSTTIMDFTQFVTKIHIFLDKKLGI